MKKRENSAYLAAFIPFALATFLCGTVGGFGIVMAPAFVTALGLSYHSIAWLTLFEAISAAALAPVFGKLRDRMGGESMILGGVLLLLLGSVMAAVAPTLAFMLVAQLVTGAGSAAVAPAVMSYIVRAFPAKKMAMGFSLYMLIASLSAVIAPALGGLLLVRRGWRDMMWICAACCLLVLLVCLLLPHASRRRREKREELDAKNAVTVLVFFGFLLALPTVGQTAGWRSGAFCVIFAVVLFSLLVLIWVEKSARFPVLERAVLKKRSFWLSVTALFLVQGMMRTNVISALVLVYCTDPQNAPIAGLAVSFCYFGVSLGSILLGPLADLIEARGVLALSFSAAAFGVALMLFFSHRTPFFLLAASLGVLGLGLGANATVLMRVVLFDVPREHAGGAAGTYGLFSDLATPLGVALLVPFFGNRLTAGTTLGMTAGDAALEAVYTLALLELVLICFAFVSLFFLRRIHRG